VVAFVWHRDVQSAVATGAEPLDEAPLFVTFVVHAARRPIPEPRMIKKVR
jgi:hypothetical protein